jgi:tagaturonate reductase
MQLGKKTIPYIEAQPGLVIPAMDLFDLPEKVLQFGTGVLLRALPDYFIDKANRQGIFNGRIVVVKSTSNGDTHAFSKQDGLYTICVRGVENGKQVDETIINSSISRVLSAKEDWEKILETARNPAMQVIISNTTEVGIVLVNEIIGAEPPLSFPAKLLAYLMERYKAFNGSDERGMVIVPTELIIDNGSALRSIVVELARFNKLDDHLLAWIENANHFCNSLVDRIVPGKLPDTDLLNTQLRLGYKDELMILTECSRLWAIESDNERVKDLLSFAAADKGVVIADNIDKFRELKLRLLNGTHTFSCGLAYLSGFSTVKEAMDDKLMCSYIKNLAIKEIAIAVSGEMISRAEALEFANGVLDRFRNSALDHRWLSISVQFSSKMKMRNVPILLRHYSRSREVPEYMAMGFAAYLLFMRSALSEDGDYYGEANGMKYKIQDDHALKLSAWWSDLDPERLVDNVMADKGYWGEDLSVLPGFKDKVKVNLRSLIRDGVKATLQPLISQKEIV